MKDLFYCHLAVIPVRAEPSDPSEIVTQLLFGELLQVLEEKDQWRKIKCLHDGYEGWTDEKLFRPFKGNHKRNNRLYANTLSINTLSGPQVIVKGANLHKIEDNKIRIGEDKYDILGTHSQNWKENLETIAMSYLNAPYLWGGRSIFGVDCSGFTQTVFSFKDIQLPRDAYQQAEVGKLIELGDQKPMDLAFFVNSKGKVIHVGICLDDDKIIHAYGKIRVDKLDDKGIWVADMNKYSHTFSHIKRIS
jgi:hypothetical protein